MGRTLQCPEGVAWVAAAPVAKGLVERAESGATGPAKLRTLLSPSRLLHR